MRQFFLICIFGSLSCVTFASTEVEEFSLALTQIDSIRTQESKTIADTKHSTTVLSHGHKTKYVVLSLPGLQESPFYLQGINNIFFNLGANVVGMHMPGHQQLDASAINNVSAQDWETAVQQILPLAEKLGEKLVLFGYSTGGTLAMQIALREPKRVHQLFLAAPALGLTDGVFLATIYTAPLGTSKICDIENPGLICHTLDKIDHQIYQRLKEGVQPSPAAGRQVQVLIDRTVNEFGDPQFKNNSHVQSGRPKRNYYKLVRSAYAGLKVPLFLIISEADTVTNSKVSLDLFINAKGPKHLVNYDREMGVSHLILPKGKVDAFKSSPDDSYNPYFDQLAGEIGEFWNSLELSDN